MTPFEIPGPGPGVAIPVDRRFGRVEHGLQLCAKRILVQHNCRELLPEYLRFMFGLVDSADLPLNVSREALQDNTVFRKIKKVLTKKVLSQLESLAADKPDEYLTFYHQFGITLREGLHSDFEHREELAGLLRFATSALPPEAADKRPADSEKPGVSTEPLTGFSDYLKRAPEGQKQIYFLAGPDRKSLELSAIPRLIPVKTSWPSIRLRSNSRPPARPTKRKRRTRKNVRPLPRLLASSVCSNCSVKD